MISVDELTLFWYHRATWLSSVVSWTSKENARADDNDEGDECVTTIDKLRAVYAQAQEGLNTSSRVRFRKSSAIFILT